MFTTLNNTTNSTSAATSTTTSTSTELNDIENDNFKQMQTNLATLLSRASDLDMLVLNQLVVLAAACNTFNSNQIAHLKRIDKSMAKSPKSAPVVEHSTYFNFNSNDVTSITTSILNEEEIELEEDDEVYDYDLEEIRFNANNNKNLNLKQIKESSTINRYYSNLNKQQQFMNQQETLNNCLAVDCNLASLSMSCCLSSSSSTSSLSSSSSSSSSKKSLTTNTNPCTTNQSDLTIITTSSTNPTSLLVNSTINTNLTPKQQNTQLINRKLQLISNNQTKRKQSKSSSSIIPYLTSSKKYLSSSNDCLSSDEGYVGSYSDTSLNKLNNKDENELTSLNNQSSLTDNNNSNLIVLNIFNTKQDNDDDELTMSTQSISNELDNELDYLVLTSTRLLNIDLYESLNSAKTCLECFNNELSTKCSKCCFDDDDLAQLVTQLSLKRVEKERELELEMRSINWRHLLDQQSRLNRMQKEFNDEDLIDLMAYLNEIEMNLDYFQADSTPSNDLFIDDLLRFKTNRMAFNLRQYHSELEQHRIQKQQKQMLITRFANFDSIPEFIPTQDDLISEYYVDLVEQQHNQEDLDQENEELFQNLVDYDLTYCEQLIEHDLNQDDYFTNLNSNDYTLIETQTYNNTETTKNKNSDSESPSSATTTISEQPNTLMLGESELAQTDEYEYYYENEEDYELYEDQLMIDSLSEQEAITLLRNESEMYALQMAQASKLGIILNSSSSSTSQSNNEKSSKSKSKSKKKNRFNSGTNTTNSQTNTDSETSLKHQQEQDIFENVFNYSESVNTDLIDDYSDNYNEFEFNSDLSYEPMGHISVSLRNSLLKLRHKRRHLARLIENENKKSASTASSSPSTTSSHLIKQMSSVSRKPCVYMLNDGRCMRADCRFAHDLKTITCKYWLDGECLKGENCEFLHDHLPEEPKSLSSSYKSKSKKEKNSTQIIKQDFKLDTEEFPALGGSLVNITKQHQIKTVLASSPTPNKKDETNKQINTLVNTKQPVKTAASVLLSKLASNNNANTSNSKTSTTTNSNSNSNKTAAVNIVSKTTNSTQQPKKID